MCSRLASSKDLNVFIFMESSRKLDQKILLSKQRCQKGKSLGAMDGLLYAVKDNIAAKNIPTTCGSRFLKDYVTPFNSTVVDRLTAQGAVMIGKTNMDEFGMGESLYNIEVKRLLQDTWWRWLQHNEISDSLSANLISYFGPCKSHLLLQSNKTDNKCQEDVWLVPGGSSGGSAVAVATKMCDFALGSDTGGSVRLPASFCGIVGFKPSYGRISRYGLIPLASSLDTVGIFTRNVSLCAAIIDAVAGLDEKDSSTFQRPHLSCFNNLGETTSKLLKGKKFGIPKEYLCEVINPEYKKLVDTIAGYIENNGGQVSFVSLPHTELAIPCYNVICAAEVSSNMAKFTGLPFGYSSSEQFESCNQLFAKNRMEGLGPVVQHRIIAGTYFLSYRGRRYYEHALCVRRLITQEFQEVFSHVDALLTPTTINNAPFNTEIDKLGPVESCVYDKHTVPVNLAGLPAISLPLGSSNGLPLGVQLICNNFQENTLLQIAKCLESIVEMV